MELVAAEDTRHAGQLLTRLGIHTRLLSLHEHNEAARVEEVLAVIQSGADVALISDAGTPLISDPGFRLLAAARAAGLPVSPVPGSCAAVAALSIAGLPTDRFYFEGFLPSRQAARVRRLQELVARTETLVFYESVQRLPDTLIDAATAFGADRPAAVARELTKLHETIYRGTLTEVLAAVRDDPGGGKGECTWLVAGNDNPPAAATADLARVVRILAGDLPAAQAATLAARITGGSRRDAYRLAVARGGQPRVVADEGPVADGADPGDGRCAT